MLKITNERIELS